MFLTSTEEIYVCGGDAFYFPIENSAPHIYLPQKINLSIKNIKEIDCGMYHMAILTNTGKLYLVGMTRYGALGSVPANTTILSQNTFQEFINVKKIKNVKCGRHQTIMVTEDNKVWICGGYDLFDTFDNNEKNAPRILFK